VNDHAQDTSVEPANIGSIVSPPADELLDLLVSQHELYRQLRRLAMAQHDLIAAEDPTGLLNLLSQRQRLIDQLAEINLKLEPARADWKRVESMLTTEQRGKAQKLVEQVGQLLAEILQADEADSKVLSARKQVIGQKIQATAASAQVQAAYRRVAGPIRPQAGANVDKQ
jgi:chorismate mutase